MKYVLPFQEGTQTGSEMIDLDVTFWLHNWKRQGDCLRYHCGNFTLDDITYSGTPSQCVIRGVSIPAGSSFQTDPVSRTWNQITLRQIAEEMKEKYAMTDLFYWGAEPVLESVEQSSQSDSSFLYELCEKQGMFLKIYKKALVIFDKAVYEPRGITARFTENDFDGKWSWNTTLNGTWTGAAVSYTVPRSKKGEKAEVVDIVVGEGTRLLHINEKAVTISFTAMGDPNVVATCNIEIYGMGRCNGKYFVDKVKQRISGSGYTMSVSGYRIFGRL